MYNGNMKTKVSGFRSYFFLCILFFTAQFISCSKENTAVLSFECMDTIMTIRAYGANVEETEQKIKQRLQQLETIYSTTSPESDIYKLNAMSCMKAEEKSSDFFDFSLQKETAEILQLSLRICKESSGALNPFLYPVTKAWGFTTKNYKVPSESELEGLAEFINPDMVQLNGNTLTLKSGMMADLGAVGKGYAGDEAIRLLKEQGITSAVLDLGGNVQVLGLKPDGQEWNIGLRSPWDGDPVLSLKLQNSGLITSGGYVRFFTADDGKEYIHIFDGKTMHPVNNGLASVSIICSSGAYGDALSTTLFVSGRENAIEYWKQHRDFDFILITEDRELIYTTNLKDKIKILTDFESVTII